MVSAMAAMGAAAIAAAFFVTESPSEARLRRIDEHRVQDLQRLSAAIDLHHSRTGSLPTTTLALQTTDQWETERRDPVSRAEYEYRALDDGSRYELCATFDRDNISATSVVVFWTHGAGRTCFTIKPKEARRYALW